MFRAQKWYLQICISFGNDVDFVISIIYCKNVKQDFANIPQVQTLVFYFVIGCLNDRWYWDPPVEEQTGVLHSGVFVIFPILKVKNYSIRLLRTEI